MSADYKLSIIESIRRWFLAAIAVIYALLAGIHTVQDFDLGWQLATGRWIVQHHHVFSSDVFSYTANGAPWIYPPFSGIICYVVYQLGGYALLSCMGAVACAGTVALLLRRGSLAVSALALISIPLIANGTQPRAAMFTTLLFAGFLRLLFHHHDVGHEESVRSYLWLIPILMILWVNLHLGFIAGLALCGWYALAEILQLPSVAKRSAALTRLGRAWPWLVLTAAATLINPWGPRIYVALVRQQRAQELHNRWIVEWESIRPSWASLHQALNWRDPQSAFWWLLVAAVVALGVALWRRKWVAALLLTGSFYLTIQHTRLQALFACVVVVIGAPLIDDLWHSIKARPKQDSKPFTPSREFAATTVVLALALTSLAGVRSWDLVTNNYYLRSQQLALFGTGLSWWYPERAVEFLLREKLPANVFNPYSLGGYLTWRLFPAYRDYIDGRALPFGSELFFRAYDLSVEPPDSAAWQQEAEARGINTIIVPLGRYQGMTVFPQLHAFCRSKSWKPVYLDEVSAIFVRHTDQTDSLIARRQLDCAKISFALPADVSTAHSIRAKAELFNAWANAGGVLYSLARYPEALECLDRAQTVFQKNANVHLLRALVLQQVGRAAEAESEFRTSLNLEPNDEAWFDLGLFYMTQARYADAAEIFRRSAESSARPHEMWMMLGQADLQMRQPQAALQAFDKAVESSPFGAEGEKLGSRFSSLIATGRAKAWYQLGDLPQAVSFQEEAVRLAPNDPRLWLGLADLYDAQGRTTKAAEARNHVQGR